MVGRLKDINWTTGNNTETLRNVSTSQGLIQVIVRDEVPFKVTRIRSRARGTTHNTHCPQVVGFSSVPRLEFAEFRSNETYITVRRGGGRGTVCSWWCRCT